jgi:hypothetical protein
MNVDLYIDELVLDGFDPSDGYQIGDAFEAELRKLILKGDIRAGLSWAQESDFEYESIDSSPVQLESNASARAIGSGVAGAIHGVLIERLTEGSKGNAK